jgi:hypothetical protein
VLKKLSVVGQDNHLERVLIGLCQKVSESASMLDVEAIDHVVQDKKAQVSIEGLRHCQEECDAKRI